MLTSISDNLKNIQEQINNAAINCKRDPSEITLVAVSKLHSPESINEAIAAGVRDLGENHAQELCKKYDQLNLSEGIRIHFIGHLQTNKVKQIIDKVDLIQSCDSIKLLEEINRQSQRIGKITNVLIELNLSGDENKFGLDPSLLEDILLAGGRMDYVRIKGLMTIASVFCRGEAARPCFNAAHKLFVDTKAKRYDNVTMEILSMGMSGDFREAITEGATMVRIGTAIFGERNYL